MASVFDKYMDQADLDRIVEFETVGEMWARCAGEFAGRPAILDQGVTHTYGELDEDMARFRGMLAAKGIVKGDYVGVYLKNSYDFVRAYLAAVTLGAVAVLLPPHLDAMSVLGCSMKFHLKALVYQEDTAGQLDLLRAKNPAVALIDAAGTGEDRAPMGEVTGDDPCAVLFTGGTTGKSKGALLGHRAMMKGTRNGCYGIKNVFFQKYYLILPLTHVFGLIRNLMTSLYTGSELAICRNNKDMFREMMVFLPTILVMVPALAEMTLNLNRQFGRNMLGDSVKTIICGAATVSPYLKSQFREYGITLFSGYGLTEGANLSAANPEPEAKAESVGFPYPEQEIRIVDGELWLRGPNMMMGYVGEEEAEGEVWAGDGWFKTGDLVRQDEEGFLYIVGRVKDLIVLPTGENVSPAEYEAVFDRLELVQDCLIYEEQSDKGSSLVLEVYPRQAELAKVDAPDKKEHLRQELSRVNMTLPPFARVSRIIIRDQDFKRSPNMKVLRDQT